MKTIWKYTLLVTDRQTITLPEGAIFLDVQLQNGEPQIWALVDPKVLQDERVIIIHGTGHPINNDVGNYIATFQQPPFIWHVFEAPVTKEGV